MEAITVPKFDFCIKAPGLERVVSLLRGKGYTLADDSLSGSRIADIQFLLGSNYAGILPVSSKPFGNKETSVPSCLLDSPVGVMLQGRASLIIENSANLPNLDSRWGPF